MDNPSNPQQHADISRDDPAPIFPRASEEHPVDPKKVTSRCHHHHEKKKKKWSDLEYHDKAIIELTFGILFIAGLTAYIFLQQADIMKGQLEEMKGTGLQTERLIILNTGQMTNAAKTAAAAQIQAQAAQDNVKAVQRQMRTQQRAWVTPPPGTPANPPIGINKSVSVPLIVQNTGKTPAIHVQTRAELNRIRYEGPWEVTGAATYDRMGSLFPDERMPPVVATWKQFAKPGKPGPTDQIATPLLLSESDYRELTGGKAFFALMGDIRYKDVFGISHWTHFCYAITYSKPPRITDNVRRCTDFNNVDSDN